MVQLIGTEKRPLFWVQEEMRGGIDTKIMWAQISENGLWIEFYTEDSVFVFQFPIVAVNSLVKSYNEKS